MHQLELNKWLLEDEKGVQLSEILPDFIAHLPEGVQFESDRWDLLSWVLRKGNRRTAIVSFEKLKNKELKYIAKTYILYKRETRLISQGMAETVTSVFMILDTIIGPDKSVLNVTNQDFIDSQNHLSQNFAKNTPIRFSGFLQNIGAWMSDYLGLRITYKSSLESIYIHGRKTQQSGNEEKLIPTEVLRDLVSSINRDDLSTKDRFFISALTINVACGFRIGELLTLPANCLIEEENQTGIRYFPAKKGKLGVRWIPSSIVPTIKSCLEFIQSFTESGRELTVLNLNNNQLYKWREIIQDKEALRYFVKKLAFDWTSDSQNNLLNKTGAWYEPKKIYIDVLTELERNNGNLSEVSRKLGISRNGLYQLKANQLLVRSGKLPQSIKRNKNTRTSWDTDSRMFSSLLVCKLMDITLKPNLISIFADIVNDVQKCQLVGEVYPKPETLDNFEIKYRITNFQPFIVDKNNKPILEAKDALFVIKKYSLSNIRSAKSNEISYITTRQFTSWLTGEKRSLGTKGDEDSCFNRLGIINPRTGEVAKFISHDVRHWLNTMYQIGGMSEDRIALIFGRKVYSNHVYDQTDNNTRLNRLRESVRKGAVLGHLTSTYNKLAEYSREEAEQYLSARTIMVNPMPHGLCSNNWSAMPCPHHLSCFAGEHENVEDVCEHFEVEPDDKNSIIEIERINHEAEIATQVIPLQSPQYKHFQRIEFNTRKLLNKLNTAQDSIE